MKSRKTIEKSMKSRKTIEKSLKKAMEKGTWPIVPYGACHGVTGSVRGVGRGGKSRPACLETGGSGCHLVWTQVAAAATRNKTRIYSRFAIGNGSSCHLGRMNFGIQMAATAI